MSRKTFSPFFLAFWLNEDKYSCVSRENIVDGAKRKESDKNLLDLKSLDISFNRRIYQGKLLYAGQSQKDVNSYLLTMDLRGGGNSHATQTKTDENAKRQSRNQKALKRILDIYTVLKNINEVDSTHSSQVSNSEQSEKPEVLDEVHVVEESARVARLEKKLKKSKRKIEKLQQELEDEHSDLLKYKDKVKGLQRKLKRYRGDQTAKTDIGNGVLLNAALVERAKIFSATPAILGRNLLRLAFDDSELVGKSLFGKICNANKERDAKPSIDDGRRDAVINYCLSCLESDARKNGGNFDKCVVRAKIVKSLGEYIREVTYKESSRMGENPEVADA